VSKPYCTVLMLLRNTDVGVYAHWICVQTVAIHQVNTVFYTSLVRRSLARTEGAVVKNDWLQMR